MKRLYIGIFLILMVAILSTVTSKYITSSTNDMVNRIENIQNSFKHNRYDDAKNQILDLKENWQSTEYILSIFMHHTELNNIAENIKIMEVSLMENYESDFWIESTKAISTLYNLNHSERLSLENIL